MDATRFDDLLRRLTTARSRRDIGRVLSALALGGGSAAVASDAAAKPCPPCRKKNGQGKCVKKKPDDTKCGTCKVCKNGDCKRADNGAKCGKCKECQAGQCQPVANDTACGTCRSCQNGQCALIANGEDGPNCNGPCKSCIEGACIDAEDGSACSDNPCEACLDGTCTPAAKEGEDCPFTGSDRQCQSGDCLCPPLPPGSNIPVGGNCDELRPEECASGKCGCSAVVCPCFCRNANCAGPGGDCTSTGTFGCCSGLCVENVCSG